MRYLINFNEYNLFESKGSDNSENSDNLRIIEDILLSLRDDGKCQFDMKENTVYAVIDEEEDFREVEEVLDSWGFSYVVNRPKDNSDWIKRNFQGDKDVLETTKWRILVWDDVVESVFKGWVDRANFTVKSDKLGDILCEREGDLDSWLFCITSEENRRKTNFLYIRNDLWEIEMQKRFGLSHTIMKDLMGALCLKYLIPGEDLKNWVIHFMYRSQFRS